MPPARHLGPEAEPDRSAQAAPGVAGPRDVRPGPGRLAQGPVRYLPAAVQRLGGARGDGRGRGAGAGPPGLDALRPRGRPRPMVRRRCADRGLVPPRLWTSQRPADQGAHLQPLLVAPLWQAGRERRQRRPPHRCGRARAAVRRHGVPRVRGRRLGAGRRGTGEPVRGNHGPPRALHRLSEHGVGVDLGRREEYRGGPRGPVVRHARGHVGTLAAQGERTGPLLPEPPRPAAAAVRRPLRWRGDRLQLVAAHCERGAAGRCYRGRR
mmetsp:Transcript_97915/g.299233  ORF Transcript_97915/g.299233 Transcript_97915/m.299233 type:complete len:266 (+) Transcript_97915:402-1199(+)